MQQQPTIEEPVITGRLCPLCANGMMNCDPEPGERERWFCPKCQTEHIWISTPQRDPNDNIDRADMQARLKAENYGFIFDTTDPKRNQNLGTRPGQARAPESRAPVPGQLEHLVLGTFDFRLDEERIVKPEPGRDPGASTESRNDY